MKPYLELTYRGQIKRLRKLANLAMQNYEVEDYKLEFINHAENTTFKVITRQNNIYLLRIHRPGYHSKEGIKEELVWLDALGKETKLIIPKPQLPKSGDFLQYIEARGIPEKRYCALFKWVHGRFLYKKLSPGALYKVGVLTAKLQEHGKQFKKSIFTHRPLWDGPGLVSEYAIWGNAIHKYVPKTKRKTILKARDIILEKLKNYQHDPEFFGIIHADLHHGNYLFQKGEVCAIDFDDCGRGYYLYDLAVTAAALANHPKCKDLGTALIDGYKMTTEKEKFDWDLFYTMIVARRISLLGWLCSRSDNPMLIKHINPALERAIKACKYLDGKKERSFNCKIAERTQASSKNK